MWGQLAEHACCRIVSAQPLLPLLLTGISSSVEKFARSEGEGLAAMGGSAATVVVVGRVVARRHRAHPLRRASGAEAPAGPEGSEGQER